MSKLGTMAGLAWVGPVSCVPLSMRETRAARVRTRTGCGVPRASASERNSICSVFVPADGKGCHCREAETSVRLRFLGSSRTSPCLLVSDHMGCRAQSAMAGRKLMWASISQELRDDAKQGRVCGIGPRGWRSVPLTFCIPPIQHIEAISAPSGSTQPCSPGRAQVWPLAYTPQHVLEILPADALGSDLLELRTPDPR